MKLKTIGCAVIMALTLAASAVWAQPPDKPAKPPVITDTSDQGAQP